MVLRMQCPRCGYAGEVTKKVKEDEKHEYYECTTCRHTPHVWKVKKEEVKARIEEEAKKKERTKKTGAKKS